MGHNASSCEPILSGFNPKRFKSMSLEVDESMSPEVDESMSPEVDESNLVRYKGDFDIPEGKGIGEGMFSNVIKGYDRKNENEVVFKKVNTKNNSRYVQLAEKEISIMNKFRKYKNTYINNYYGYFLHDRDYYLVYDKLDMNLYELYTGYPDYLTFIACVNITRQCLEGLTFIHQFVIHCDLKPENIMIDKETQQIKIIDFGSSEFIDSKKKRIYDYVVSRYYRAPEILYNSIYDQKIDIWSIACIFFELLFKSAIFPGKNSRDLVFIITQYIGIPKVSDFNDNTIAKSGIIEKFRLYFNDDNTFIRDRKTRDKKYVEYDETNLSESISQYFEINEQELGLDKYPDNGEYDINNSIAFFKSVFQYDITKRPSAEECLKLELFRTTFI
tara:strand:- start:1503 stop:2663 length:1161 start_codon:yes stop_codon:yes gene_type:complete